MPSPYKYIFIFLIFISCNHEHNPKPGKNTTIVLLPYSGFDTSLIPLIKSEIDSFYHCQIIINKNEVLPAFSFYSPRNRYKADSILVYEKQLVDKNEIIVGLTDKDISTSKNDITDWGVLGLGLCPGNVCIISTYRLEKISIAQTQLKDRLIKIILHEIGHNFGLPHCTNNPECLMNDAEGSIATVDKEKKWLCDKCRQKLNL
jgi:archaemetzincin